MLYRLKRIGNEEGIEITIESEKELVLKSVVSVEVGTVVATFVLVQYKMSDCELIQ